MSEFSRIIDSARLPENPVVLCASPDECAALARRFDLIALEKLEGRATLTHEGPVVMAKGAISASFVQSCAVSGEELPISLVEPFDLRFVPARDHGPDEIELASAELDEIEMDGTRFDLGEALAQSLALAMDPYLEGPNAETFRRTSGLLGEGEGGAFGALKGLFRD